MTKPRILITDDEPNIRLMLRTALESEGYGIDEAVNGQQALEMIVDQKFDLMLLDLNMPVLDGMRVLEQLKNVPGDQKPRAVVLTAYGSISAAVKATRLGALDFIEKPITSGTWPASSMARQSGPSASSSRRSRTCAGSTSWTRSAAAPRP